MTRGACIGLAALALGACRGASDSTIDAGSDTGPDADVAPVSAGVALGIFGVPGPGNGIEQPIFFVGCPTNGSAAVELFYLQPDDSVVDDGPHVAAFTRTGVHDHVAIGTSLVADFDESGADPSSAPFVYTAMVTADQTFFDTAVHTFAAHVLNPAVPAMNNLGAWNTDVLVTCP